MGGSRKTQYHSHFVCKAEWLELCLLEKDFETEFLRRKKSMPVFNLTTKIISFLFFAQMVAPMANKFYL